MKLEELGNGQLIKAYLEARKKKKLIEAEAKKKTAPYTDLMERIENVMLERMQESNTQNVTAKGGGLAYISETYTAPIRDKSAFLDFLIEQDAWELLDLKANAPAVREFMQERGIAPNGVELKPRIKVNFRN